MFFDGVNSAGCKKITLELEQADAHTGRIRFIRLYFGSSEDRPYQAQQSFEMNEAISFMHTYGSL